MPIPTLVYFLDKGCLMLSSALHQGAPGHFSAKGLAWRDHETQLHRESRHYNSNEKSAVGEAMSLKPSHSYPLDVRQDL